MVSERSRVRGEGRERESRDPAGSASSGHRDQGAGPIYRTSRGRGERNGGSSIMHKVSRGTAGRRMISPRAWGTRGGGWRPRRRGTTACVGFLRVDFGGGKGEHLGFWGG